MAAGDAVDWCTIRQAIRWIETGELSAKDGFDEMLRNRLEDGVNPLSAYLRFWLQPGACICLERQEVWVVLLGLLRSGEVAVRGRPAVGGCRVSFPDSFIVQVDVAEWELPKFISPNLIPDGPLQVPNELMNSLPVNIPVTDGFIGDCWMLYSDGQAYSQVEVDLKQLKRAVALETVTMANSCTPISVPAIESDAHGRSYAIRMETRMENGAESRVAEETPEVAQKPVIQKVKRSAPKKADKSKTVASPTGPSTMVAADDELSMYTVMEAAGILKIGKTKIYQLMDDKKLKYKGDDGMRRIKKCDLQAYIDNM